MKMMSYKTNEKMAINDELVSLIHPSLTHSIKFFLDSPELNTLHTLLRHNVGDNCIIPNHIERLSVPINVRWLDMPCIGGIKRLEPNSVGWMFLDFMGHLYGNKSTYIYPKKDIEYAFKNKVFKNNALFAITLSRRSINSLKDKREWGVTCTYIYLIARKYGYETTFLTGRFYKKIKNMYFIAFRVMKK